MNNKTTNYLSIFSLLIAVGSLVFSLGYFKANVDRLIELTDTRAEQLRVKQIVDRALDQRLQTIMEKLETSSDNQDTKVDQTNSAQELPTVVLDIKVPIDKAIIKQNVIEVSGTHSMPLSAFVWILLGDSYGNFYLQNPPVILRRDGTWSATNIRPGQGITAIHAVYVNSKGNEIFRKMIRNNEWGGFTTLPSSTRILDTMNIVVNR